MWGHVSAPEEFLECTSFSARDIAITRWWSIVLCPFFLPYQLPYQMYSSAELLELPYVLLLPQSQSGTYHHLMSEIWQQSSCWFLCLCFPVSSASCRSRNMRRLCYFPRRIRGSVNATAPDGVRHPPNALMFLPPDSPFALAWHVLLTSFPRWHKILSFKHTQNFFLSKSDFINVTRSLVIESI